MTKRGISGVYDGTASTKLITKRPIFKLNEWVRICWVVDLTTRSGVLYYDDVEELFENFGGLDGN